MTVLHAAIGNSLLLLVLICLGWSAFGLVSGRGVTPGLRGTVVLTLAVAIGQLVLGGLLVVVQGATLNPIHLLYGLSLIVALGGAHLYGGRAGPGREVLIYALVTLFAVGLVLRAMETVGRPL